MKIWLDPGLMYLRPLQRKLLLQGETITTSDEADLALTNESNKNPSAMTPQKRIMGGVTIPQTIVEGLGYPFADVDPSFTLTRWFEKNTYLTQTFLGFPFFYPLNDDLGPRTEAGVVGRYTNEVSLHKAFEEVRLSRFLQQLEYSGFVTLYLGEEHRVCGLHLGAPFWSLYNLMVGVRGNLAKWFMEPTSLLESWTATMLLSSYQDQATVDPRAFDERHIWLNSEDCGREHVVRTGKTVALLDSFGPTLAKACSLALSLCREFPLESKVYRTDMQSVATERYIRLKESLGQH